MSKGPGRIEHQLTQIFQKNPKWCFSTRELCCKVYRTKHVEKKHRVSVLRALKRLSARSMPDLWRRAIKGKRDDEWFDYYREWKYPSFPPKDGAPAKSGRPRKKSPQKYKAPWKYKLRANDNLTRPTQVLGSYALAVLRRRWANDWPTIAVNQTRTFALERHRKH